MQGRALFPSLVVLAVAAALGGVCASGVAADAPAGATWSGQSDTRYRWRGVSGESDQDAFQALRLDWQDAEAGHERVSAHLHGLALADVDDLAGRGEFDPLRDRQDAYDGHVQGRLYSAHAEVQHLAPRWLDTARLGRQFLFRGETLHFDGANLETRYLTPARVSARAFGGVPVRLSGESVSGDLVAGAGLGWRPLAFFGLTADAVHLEDERPGPTRRDDDLFVGAARLALGPCNMEGGVTLLGDPLGDLLHQEDLRDRRVWCRATWSDGDGDWLVVAEGQRLRETVGDLVTDLSPYYPIAADLQPYHQGRLLVWHALSEHASAEAGALVRALADEADASRYNREFERYHLTLHLEELLPGNSVALTGESWQTQGAAGGAARSDPGDDTYSYGLDLRQGLGERWRVGAGGHYSLFKYDRLTGDEREDVWTTFGEVEWRLGGDWRWSGTYERERSERETYHVAETGVRRVF